jgi:uncharacterized protein YjbI with pentapeptide repeats
MGNTNNKDIFYQYLRNGMIDEFNSSRPNDKDEILDLTEIYLRNMTLSNLNLSNVDLSGSDFSESEILEGNFSQSILSSVNFSHSIIENSNFAEVIFEGSLLNKSKIINCDFSSSDMNGANICGTDLSGSDLSICHNLMKAIYDADTIWPDEECLPDDFNPQYEINFAEFENNEEFMEDQFSF